MASRAHRLVFALLFALAQGTATARNLEAQVLDPRAGIFLARGCTECHGVWALHLRARSDVGPDLTFAYADVQARFNESLAAFLYNPSGVMRLLLVEHVHLSLADRDSITHVLEGIYREHRAQLDDDAIPIAGAVPW
ncbi:MAG TPA: hypothetical protein VLT79_02550 [Gemmatimonadales bacterium]|nr:hypothetical protein [Gemmatimonadales bacterium]